MLRLTLAITLLGLGLASSYDVDRAYKALHFSKISYCEPEEISSWSCIPCQSDQTDGFENV